MIFLSAKYTIAIKDSWMGDEKRASQILPPKLSFPVWHIWQRREGSLILPIPDSGLKLFESPVSRKLIIRYGFVFYRSSRTSSEVSHWLLWVELAAIPLAMHTQLLNIARSMCWSHMSPIIADTTCRVSSVILAPIFKSTYGGTFARKMLIQKPMVIDTQALAILSSYPF